MTLMPEIRDQLLGAAERRATARRPRLLAPLGRLLGYGVLAGSIAIVVAVVAVIVLAGGRRSDAVRDRALLAAELIATLGVLRRPQLPSDLAAARAILGNSSPQQSDRTLVRIAAVTPSKMTIVLVPLQPTSPTSQNPGYGETLEICVVAPRIASCQGAPTAAQVRAIGAWANFGAPPPMHPRSTGPLVMVVPDGVAKVTILRSCRHAASSRPTYHGLIASPSPPLRTPISPTSRGFRARGCCSKSSRSSGTDRRAR
jgi:hypothetical protein